MVAQPSSGQLRLPLAGAQPTTTSSPGWLATRGVRAPATGLAWPVKGIDERLDPGASRRLGDEVEAAAASEKHGRGSRGERAKRRPPPLVACPHAVSESLLLGWPRQSGAPVSGWTWGGEEAGRRGGGRGSEGEAQ